MVGHGDRAPLKLHQECREECCSRSVLKLPVAPETCGKHPVEALL